MGTWGTAIFSDDTASDVRGDFRDLIGDGLSPEAATDRLVAEYASSIDDPDDGPPFWLGLAVTQWKCGRLQERAKTRALHIIDSGADLLRWSEDAKAAKARQAVLAKTRALLLSPPPAGGASRSASDSPMTGRWARSSCTGCRRESTWCFASWDTTSTRVEEHRKWISSTSTRTPRPRSKMRARLPRHAFAKREFEHAAEPPFMLGATSKREIPQERLTRLGPYGVARRTTISTRVLLWRWGDAFIEKTMAAQRIVCRPGPGGDDHERWEVGDVLAHQTASGTHVLFQLIGRYEGDGLDGAPIVALLNWQEESLPTSEALRSGTLVPYRLDVVRGKIVLSSSGRCDACFVFVHEDGEAVDPLALRRIGNFTPTRDDRVRSIASLPMAIRRIERDLRPAARQE